MSFILKNKFFDELPKSLKLDVKHYKDISLLNNYLKEEYDLNKKDYIILYNGRKVDESHLIKEEGEYLLLIPVFGG